jgi:phosphoribosylglycinamide formyltransferase-1
MNIAFLASHRGSNIQAVIDACKDGHLHARPCVVISNNSDSEALMRAKQEGIPNYHRSAKTHPDPRQLDEEMMRILVRHQTEIVVLAGYMKKLGPNVLKQFQGRIINIHPALLPKYGGQGMCGPKVHEAVLASGDKETGATIHLVDEVYDHGAILSQCRVPVRTNDSVENLSLRVLECEHKLLVETLENVILGKIRLPKQLT